MKGIKEKNRLLLERATSGDKSAEEAVIKENMGLVKSIAQRFTGRGTDLEDLVQIGAMGMLKAIRGYDKSYNTVFSTYAVPLIMGEIKRFLRDDGLIKVSREAKRSYRILMNKKEEYIRLNGAEPGLEELCALCGISKEDGVYAISACSGAVSLNERVGEDGTTTLEELCEDVKIGDITEKIALMQAIDSLDSRDRSIIYMRYFREMTQSQVAQILGITQVKVSRTEKKIISVLKNSLKSG